ncbi:MAG: putative fluoride ion transporter CrcB [Lysobacterales bacterium]|jgi:CrcB protein|nr:MAG: putative fluoride ion transporter CrcB [Xanthomonadales bacterium]
MPERASVLLAIAAGSGLGGLLRLLFTAKATPDFPWGLLLANLLGCFLIAFYHELTRPGGRIYHRPVLRQFIMSGLLGGFTSFSLVALESLLLASASGAWAVIGFLLLSGLSWIAAAYLGRSLARLMMFHSRGA